MRGYSRLGLALLLAIFAAGFAAGGSGDASHSGGGRAGLNWVREVVAPGLPSARASSSAAPAVDAVARVRAYAPVVANGGRHRGHYVALTFDDGPGPFTWRVMRVLSRLGVPATFFQVGRQVVQYPAVARAVTARYPIGDHTFSHAPMTRLPWAAQLREVRAGAGWRSELFRPPYEMWNRQTLGVMRVQRMLMVLWDVDSRDWTRPGVGRIVAGVVRGVRPGSIVLMHDGGGNRAQTVAALPAIVRGLRRRGYRFVTVPRMMAVAPPWSGAR